MQAGQGFSRNDLERYTETLAEKGIESYMVDLTQGNKELPEAWLLVIPQGIGQILDKPNAEVAMYAEHAVLEWDQKAYMYGRVVNKHARWNVCYDEKAEEPDYEKKRGRVVALDTVPMLRQLMGRLEEWFGEKFVGLKVEGNRYYDADRCGIGFHGDTERVKVAALRLGTPDLNLPIHYQWYKEGERVGAPIVVPLFAGDMYVMSEKAVGTDWKRKTIYTLRHATGAEKYTA